MIAYVLICSCIDYDEKHAVISCMQLVLSTMKNILLTTRHHHAKYQHVVYRQNKPSTILGIILYYNIRVFKKNGERNHDGCTFSRSSML